MQLGCEALPEYVDDHQTSSSRIAPSRIIRLLSTMSTPRRTKLILKRCPLVARLFLGPDIHSTVFFFVCGGKGRHTRGDQSLCTRSK